ncbi:unnamed protein product [Orchesella dallaii]|uniref:THAP-type domain-containing protein n=1 Tax=Orchesella dallaii TaxID=48710 RepID=A0ABP1R0W9_9HEXA
MYNKKKRCIVCQKNKSKDDAESNISLFSFPSSPSKREAWIEALDLKDTGIKSSSKVCEIHFSKKQFIRDRLKPGAVPSLTARLKREKIEKSIVPVPALLLTPVSVLVTPPACNDDKNDNSTETLSIPSSSSGANALSGLPKGPNYGVTTNPIYSNETPASDNEPIPDSLKQFLLDSLKTEVATKVLKDSLSLHTFCDKFLSEIVSWKRNKLKIKEGSGQQREEHNEHVQLDEMEERIVTKQEYVETETVEDPVQFAYPLLSLKVEENDDGCLQQVKVEVEPNGDIGDDSDDGDPLGFEKGKGDNSMETKRCPNSKQEFMEWHDES